MLTPKREAFAAGLAAGQTQAAAYRAAFPHSAKWRDGAVWTEASKLAALPEVRQRVDDLMAAAAAKNGVTVERVVAELARVAFGDRRRLMTWGPNGVKLRDSETISEDDAAAVAEVSETVNAAGGSIKLKTHDKVKALELLGKYVGIFTDKVQLTGKDGGPVETKAVVFYLPENGR